jgi:mono/diheme cytochrome c family protein
MPRPLLLAVGILIAISLLPAAYLAKARVSSSQKTRYQIVYDMDTQPKFKTQTANPLFADGRSMRKYVEGTVAQGELYADSLYYDQQLSGEQPVYEVGVGGDVRDSGTVRAAVDLAYLQRGRERFEIYCSPCHGLAGRGDGLASQHAIKLAEGTWTPPADLTSDAVMARADGEIFDFISRGVRKMPSYAEQVAPRDRWAIVLYVRALQRSVRGSIEDVPEPERAALNQE